MERAYGVIPVKLNGMEPQYLIVQYQAGHWGFSKGPSKPGETAIETAKRNLLEQTGIRDCRFDDEKNFVQQYSYTKDKAVIVKDVKYFLAFSQADGGRSQGKVQRLRWVTRGEAMDIITFQSTKDILTNVHHHVQAHDLNLWT